jgi:PPOX class probable F420-dependent enzyme
MSNTIPDSHQYLLKGKYITSLATHMKNGQIQVNPVWFDHDGTHFRVNSSVGRLKDTNMRANPNVTLLILNSENGYHGLEVRGKVVEIIEGDEAWDHIDALGMKYTGKTYPVRDPNMVRSMFLIEPLRVRAIDYTMVYQKLEDPA